MEKTLVKILLLVFSKINLLFHSTGAQSLLFYRNNNLANVSTSLSRAESRAQYIVHDFAVEKAGHLVAYQAYFIHKDITVRFQVWSKIFSGGDQTYFDLYTLKHEIKATPNVTGCITILIPESHKINISRNDALGLLFEKTRTLAPISYKFLSTTNYPVFAYQGFVNNPPIIGETYRIDRSISRPKQFSVGFIIDEAGSQGTQAYRTMLENLPGVDCVMIEPKMEGEPILPTEKPENATNGSLYPDIEGLVTVGNPPSTDGKVAIGETRAVVLEQIQTNKGTVIAFQLTIKEITGENIRLQIWRENKILRRPGKRFYTLIGEKKFKPTKTGLEVVKLEPDERIDVVAGDRLGFTEGMTRDSKKSGQVSYKFNSDPDNKVYSRILENNYYIREGETRQFTTISLPRTYSIGVTYFTGTDISSILKDGPPGTNGEKGDAGPEGPQGQIGPEGARGLPGDANTNLAGEIGPKGAKGRKGDDGEKGNKGYIGTPGNPGSMGVKGSVGPKGLKGMPGSVGFPGQKGEPGTLPPGFTPKPGIKGEKGQEGDSGNFGEIGIPGSKGDRGDRGPPGEFSSRSRRQAGGSELMTCSSACELGRPKDKFKEDRKCSSGYQISANKRMCEDLNECLSKHSCPDGSQCINTMGSYLCYGPSNLLPSPSTTGGAHKASKDSLVSLLSNHFVIFCIIWLVVLTLLVICLLLLACWVRKRNEEELELDYIDPYVKQ